MLYTIAGYTLFVCGFVGLCRAAYHGKLDKFFTFWGI